MRIGTPWSSSTHPLPGFAYVCRPTDEARLNKTLLPLITVADINSRAGRLTHEDSCVIKTVEHK